MQLPTLWRSSQWRRDPLVDAEAEADAEAVEVGEVGECSRRSVYRCQSM